MDYNIDTPVKWKWGRGYGSGAVKQIFKRDVKRTINGSQIKKRGSEECPAYLIKQNDGQRVLKLHSELEQVQT